MARGIGRFLKTLDPLRMIFNEKHHDTDHVRLPYVDTRPFISNIASFPDRHASPLCNGLCLFDTPDIFVSFALTSKLCFRLLSASYLHISCRLLCVTCTLLISCFFLARRARFAPVRVSRFEDVLSGLGSTGSQKDADLFEVSTI